MNEKGEISDLVKVDQDQDQGGGWKKNESKRRKEQKTVNE
jgi:hypothetical protein